MWNDIGDFIVLIAYFIVAYNKQYNYNNFYCVLFLIPYIHSVALHLPTIRPTSIYSTRSINTTHLCNYLWWTCAAFVASKCFMPLFSAVVILLSDTLAAVILPVDVLEIFFIMILMHFFLAFCVLFFITALLFLLFFGADLIVFVVNCGFYAFLTFSQLKF